MSAIIFVGADKGGVGKTTVCRAMLDYLKVRHVAPRAVFDTEKNLCRFAPHAQRVDVESVEGKMAIFDAARAADEGSIVVDMCAGSLSDTLRDMREVGLLEKADRGKNVVMHVLGSSGASLDEIVDVNSQLAEGGRHFLVENHASDDQQFFRWDAAARAKFFESVKVDGEISIPHLVGLASEDVDRRGLSFAEYARNEHGGSQYLARCVDTWLARVYGQFDSIDLTSAARSN